MSKSGMSRSGSFFGNETQLTVEELLELTKSIYIEN